MDETKSLDIINIDTNLKSLAQQVIDESDIEKTNDLISLFNWNISKKNVARMLKLNDLFDSVTDQMASRVITKPDQFSNSDLLDYLKTIQGAIDHSGKLIEQASDDPPQIIQNNTQVNVTLLDSFDQQSRARILAAIQKTLSAASTQQTIELAENDTNIIEGDNSNEY